MKTSPEPADETLMERYARGDAAAFDQLMTRHQRPLFGFILRSVRDRAEAEDLFQEVFMKVIRAAPTWRPEAKFTTWLYTVARNALIDRSRRRKTHTPDLSLADPVGDADGPTRLDTVASPDANPLDETLGEELRQALEAALGALPEDQREALLLKRDGLTFDAIAEVTGVKANTVKSRLRYALEKLRATLHARGLKVPV